MALSMVRTPLRPPAIRNGTNRLPMEKTFHGCHNLFPFPVTSDRIRYLESGKQVMHLMITNTLQASLGMVKLLLYCLSIRSLTIRAKAHR
jgi:hypothetical protein